MAGSGSVDPRAGRAARLAGRPAAGREPGNTEHIALRARPTY